MFHHCIDYVKMFSAIVSPLMLITFPVVYCAQSKPVLFDFKLNNLNLYMLHV